MSANPPMQAITITKSQAEDPAIAKRITQTADGPVMVDENGERPVRVTIKD